MVPGGVSSPVGVIGLVFKETLLIPAELLIVLEISEVLCGSELAPIPF